jgi:hypothetical protein
MNNKYLRALRNSITIAPENSPYCKTCHKAGRSQEEYTSHWTRRTPDPRSDIICPLILESVCTNCKKTGHWKKYCPELEMFSYSSNKDRIFMNSKKYNNTMYKKSNSSNDFQSFCQEINGEQIKKSKSWAEMVDQ